MSESKELTWHAIAAANILQAQKRKGRIGTKKSRAGCGTCKTRHMKCDEGRPECQRCISTGRRCDGYAELVQSTKPPNSLIGCQLSQDLGLRESDKRSFDYFLSWAAPRLSGSLDKEFWCGDVLRYARSEPSVLDTLLAIAVLYEHPQYKRTFLNDEKDSPMVKMVDSKAFEMSRIPEPYFLTPATGVLPIDEFHAQALKSYSRALRALSTKVQNEEASPELMILSCILFMCVELERDNVFAVLKLFRHGTQLLRQFASGQGRVIANNPLLKIIEQIFVRLGVLVALWGVADPYEPHPSLSLSGEPTTFQSATDARTVLYTLLVQMHTFQTQAAEYMASRDHCPCDTDLPQTARSPMSGLADELGQVTLSSPFTDGSRTNAAVMKLQYGHEAEREINDPTTKIFLAIAPCRSGVNSSQDDLTLSKLFHALSSQQRYLESRLKQWHSSFKWVPGVEDEAATALLMSYHAAHIWLCTRLSDSEMEFDHYEEHFRKILHYAEIYTQARCAEALTFSFEIGASLPLFCVAIKCRIPSCRRRALSLLLRAPKKECHFGSRSCAELAARCIAVEEEDLCLQTQPNGHTSVDDTSLPCEGKRIRSFELIKNNPAGRWELRVFRFSMDKNGSRHREVSDHPI